MLQIRHVKKIIFSLLFAGYLFSCQDTSLTNPKVVGEPALSFIIKPEAQRQKALLDYVKSVEQDYTTIPELINDADFYLNGMKFLNIPSDSLEKLCNRWADVTDSCYNYYFDNINFSSGDTLNININIGNKHIDGIALIPSEFEIAIKDRTLSWQASRNAVSYKVEIRRSTPTYLYKSFITDKLKFSLESSIFSKGSYRLTVTAFDANSNDFFSGKTQKAGIDGAFGVFGAIRSRTLDVELP